MKPRKVHYLVCHTMKTAYHRKLWRRIIPCTGRRPSRGCVTTSHPALVTCVQCQEFVASLFPKRS